MKTRLSYFQKLAVFSKDSLDPVDAEVIKGNEAIYHTSLLLI